VSYIFIMDELFREQAQELMTLKANGAFKGNLAAFKLQMKAISDEATKRAEQRLLERRRIEDSGEDNSGEDSDQI
jgi:division protein CdvB (Snf7/Vps24/ESCRT-III family)